MEFFKTLFFVFFALAHAAIYAQEFGADESKITAEIYVSSSSGNDSNDGSMAKPLRTFAKLPKANAKIFLKCGDVFFEPLKDFKNCVIDSYSEGPAPVISGFKRIANPDAWEDLGGGVWRLDMNAVENFDGRNPAIDETTKCLNNIGAVYDAATDTLHGHKVRRMDLLRADWDIFTGEEFKAEKITVESFRYLYVKLGRNPSSEGADLHLPTYAVGIRDLRECTVKNIAIKGFAHHGLADSRGGRIDNLIIDIIGGGTQIGYRVWARLGNGIQFSGSGRNNDNLVTNCLISRTFDCGATIQGIVDKGNVCAKNISFKNNKFYRCRQAYEHFLTSRDGGECEYVNCSFEENLAWEMGENEFSSPERRDNNFLTYDRQRRGMTIKNNVCYGGGIYAGRSGWAGNFSGNTFYVLKGKNTLLWTLDNESGISAIPTNTPSDIERYRQTLNDASSKIYLVEESDAALREKLLNGQFGYVRQFLKKSEQRASRF